MGGGGRELLAVLVAGVALASCGHGKSAASREVRLTAAQGNGGLAMDENTAMNQAELEDAIQRFTGVFADRLTQALDELAEGRPLKVRNEILHQELLYTSSALDIATGPVPEVNLLDMLVFVRLCREAFEGHWIPELYGNRGRAVADVFRTSEDDLWRIAARVVSPEQRVELETLVDEWRSDNPGQVRVEGVRLMDFAQRRGQVELERAKSAGGLLSSVRGATRAADQALLIAERAMFLAHRMPFILRLQARLGSREIVSDTLASVGSPAELLAEVRSLEPLADKLLPVVEHSTHAAREARLLVRDLEPVIPSPKGVEKLDQTIDKANDLTSNARGMIHELRAITPADPAAAVTMVKRGVDDTLRRALVYLALLGGAWSALWWGGYYVIKRRLARHA
jgi:hypothetical protein